jgi:magnesium-transporting ATPase (P-type)
VIEVALILICGLVCDQLVIEIMPLSWVCVVICPLLSLALSWEQPSESLLEERIGKYHKNSPLLSGSMKKQIISQVITQAIVLLGVMFTGHLWIPEEVDAFDSVIGSNWSAKYSTADQEFVANGLYSNPLLESMSYKSTYNQYDVDSRHLTIVFNIFVLMQITNSINCRKTKDRSINILEGIELQTVGIILIVFACHFLFVMFSGTSVGLYPHGLTLIQWFISIGLAGIVWFVSFIVRLLPEPPSSPVTNQYWVNRSINLGVKLVGKKSNLT